MINAFLVLIMGLATAKPAATVRAGIPDDRPPLAQRAAAGCPLPANQLRGRTLTPALLREVLAGDSPVDTPEQLVCCVARDMDVKFAVAHSSFAAQNGSPHSPRALIYTEHPDGSLASIISINGGETNMNQHNAVELMYNSGGGQLLRNGRHGQLEFYDIPFGSGQPHVGERNPSDCMQCHARGETPGVGGPKPLMTLIPWHSFQQPEKGGAVGRCPEETQAANAASQRARQALSTNPRFQCVDPTTNISELDQQLEDLNNRRLAQLVSSTPDFSATKYVLVGLEMVCENPIGWIPPNYLSSMNQTGGLSQPVLAATNDNGFLGAFTGAYGRQANADNALASANLVAAGDLARGRNISNTPMTQGFTDCHRRTTPLRSERAAFLQQVNQGTNLIHKQYIADSLIRGAATPMTDIRFLFESRGISTADWGMMPPSHLDDYERAPEITPYLVGTDPHLQSLMNVTSPSRYSFKIPQERACQSLKTLAEAAFRRLSPANTETGDGTTSQ